MGERKGLTEAQRRALDAIVAARPVAGNDEGWVVPACSRPTLDALERKGEIERSGYDDQGVMCGAGLCRLTPAAIATRAALSERGGR